MKHLRQNNGELPSDDVLESFMRDELQNDSTSRGNFQPQQKTSRKDNSARITENAFIDPTMVYNWIKSFGVKTKDALTKVLMDGENDDLLIDDDPNDTVNTNLTSSIDTAAVPSSSSQNPNSHTNTYNRLHNNNENYAGVGKLHLHLVSATKIEVVDAAEGDHYAICSIEEFESSGNQTYSNTTFVENFRTKTVRSSATPVFDIKWTITCPSYQSCLHLALLNSTDNAVIGVAKISIYSIIIGKYGQNVSDNLKSSLTVEDNVAMRDPNEPSRIAGWFTVRVAFEEDAEALFKAKRPRAVKCPEDETLSVDRLGKHIDRLLSLISLVESMYGDYADLMNWKDALFTFFIFSVFVYTTLMIDAEYALSCPVFFVGSLFTRAWIRRTSGTFTKELIEKTKKTSEVFRPTALLRIALIDVKYGANPSSPTAVSVMHDTDVYPREQQASTSIWGLKLGNKPKFCRPFVRILYRSMRGDFSKTKSKPNAAGVSLVRREYLVGDISNSAEAPFGSTGKHFNTNFSYRGRDTCIQNIVDPWPKSSLFSSSASVFQGHSKLSSDRSVNSYPDLAFVYPILQPLWKQVVPSLDSQLQSQLKEESISTTQPKQHSNLPETLNSRSSHLPTTATATRKGTYVPWTENDSEIVLKLYSERPPQGIMDSFVSSTELGTVTIPIKEVAGNTGKADASETFLYATSKGHICEVCKWFTVSSFSLSQKEPIDEFTDMSMLESSVISSSAAVYNGHKKCSSDDENTMWILLRLQLDTSKACEVKCEPSDDESSRSNALLSILVDSEPKKKNAISTILSLRDTVEFVQNLMVVILNYIETFKNVFLWVSPAKTKPIYLALGVVWLATVVIPGRFLILLIGLYQFLFKFIPEPQEKTIAIKFNNFIQSIPNDDDIDRVYYWERKKFLNDQEVENTLKLQQSKLSLVYPVDWSGKVHIKCQGDDHWERVFLVLQRKRLVWWSNETDIEDGKAFLGQLLLYGQIQGVMQPNYIDMRETGADDSQIVVIFGRDALGTPIKCSVCHQHPQACKKLKDLVQLACEQSVD